jgi:microcystin-dependent protein
VSEPFLAEIKMFAGNFAPRNYALCNGQILPIAQNTALFSLLGTNYGGNGTSNFALPDLQGRAPMNQGNGPGLTPRQVGENGGETVVQLNFNTIPQHTHGMVGEDEEASKTSPAGNAFGVNPNVNVYTPGGASGLQTAAMSAFSVGHAGGNIPHPNMQPYLAVTFIIAMAGIYPPRG